MSNQDQIQVASDAFLPDTEVPFKAKDETSSTYAPIVNVDLLYIETEEELPLKIEVAQRRILNENDTHMPVNRLTVYSPCPVTGQRHILHVVYW